MAFVATFAGIQRSIQNSKARGLASNLLQEQMQILKQQPYYNVLVTTNPIVLPGVSPAVIYDSAYNPPQTIREGSITFTRYTLVEVADENSGSLVVLAPSSLDTGMRLLTVSVVWRQSGVVNVAQARSVFANPNTVMSRSIVNGRVTSALGGAPVPGALVRIAENEDWQDYTAADGNYTINLNAGSYDAYATAPGYFTKFLGVSAGPNQVLGGQDFQLWPISSGTVIGTAWIADHLVISQVAGAIDAGGFSQEYVEVFNPTTYTWTLSGQVGLKFQRALEPFKNAIAVDYTRPTVGPGGFFLFANTTTITAGGVSVAADAVWSATNSLTAFPFFGTQRNIIPVDADGANEGAGALELYGSASGAVIDRVGWRRSGQAAPFFESAAIAQGVGLQAGEQYARFASTAGPSLSLGPAYDSNNNSVDFHVYGTLAISPRNSLSPAAVVVAATPASGATVTSADGLSGGTVAYQGGNPPFVQFALTNVATGTWTVYVASGSYQAQIAGVALAVSGQTAAVPPTLLSETASTGYVTGRVTNNVGAPIASGIAVGVPGFPPVQANLLDGSYALALPPGTYTMFANPSNANPSYVSQSSAALTVALGQVHSGVNFVLSQGGRVKGFATRDGINALPGIAVAALDANGLEHDQEVSGTNGYYLLNNLSTGVYTVRPVLGSGETSSPSSATVTITAGATVVAATFTITGAFGAINGAVSAAGLPIATGVLIVVTTVTLTGSPPAPPALSSATLGGAPFYVTSSREDGTYSIDVRQSTSPAYRVYGYYSTLNGSSASISALTVSNVAVYAGQEVNGINFGW